jgi:opacity protein-like surface antigen
MSMHQLFAISLSPFRFFAASCFTLATVAYLDRPVFAQVKQNSIGPTITFGSGSSTFGVEGKLHLAENVFQVKNNLSLRPFLRFPANGLDLGASVTYDFDFPRYSAITPYAGLGLGSLNGITTTRGLPGGPVTTEQFSQIAFYGQAGAEINASQNLALTANLQVPFNNRLDTTFSLGANYRF